VIYLSSSLYFYDQKTQMNNQISLQRSKKTIVVMMWLLGIFAVTGLPSLTHAQNTPVSASFISIHPAQPTSADYISLVIGNPPLGTSFGGCNNFVKNPFTLTTVQNNIIITFDNTSWEIGITSGIPIPAPYKPVPIDLGRLPAGDYVITSVGAPCRTYTPAGGFKPIYYGFTVKDHRPQKVFPFNSQNFSGHWVDAKLPGHAVFITHDEQENLLGTLLTYQTNGKPVWYVFQPKWGITGLTELSPLWEASKSGNPNLPLNGATILTEVGRILLRVNSPGLKSEPDFADTRRLHLEYKVSGQFVEMILERFKP
jgi:hypothetical protein